MNRVSQSWYVLGLTGHHSGIWIMPTHRFGHDVGQPAAQVAVFMAVFMVVFMAVFMAL